MSTNMALKTQYGATVMVRPWEAGNYLRNRELVRFVLLGWRFVFGIITKRDGRESTSSDAIMTLGIMKLLLYYVS